MYKRQDQKLQLFTYDNDGSLILPRGYADRLYSLISETTTSVKWDKEQVEGEPVDFGPWNENFQIRDYQHPLIDSLLRKNGIGVSPAGSGKTIMGMRYIYEVEMCIRDRSLPDRRTPERQRS